MTIRPDAYEQLMLEMINRARLNPASEFSRLVVDAASKTGVTQDVTDALRYFNVDMNALWQGLLGMGAAPALAWNDQLSIAATNHSWQMIIFDSQSHQLPGEADLGNRILGAGYDFRGVGENVYAYATDAVSAHAAFMIDWGFTPTGLQQPAGHRLNIMDASAQEIGIGVVAESNGFTAVGPNVITQEIASRSGYQAQLLGVAINDLDHDGFYDIGEGLGGVTVTASGAAGTFTTSTWDAGGYQMALPSGSYTVTFSGMGVSKTDVIWMGGSNVKLDVFATGAGSSPAVVAPTNAETLFWNSGEAQWLTGPGAHDVFVVGANSGGYQSARTYDGQGVVLWNGASFDILNGFETLRFWDRDVQVNASGLFDLPQVVSNTGPNLVYDTYGTQWLTGTGAQDIFVINATSSNYSSGRTYDGQGVVVWSGVNFDILTGFETLRFWDRDVQAGADGLFSIQSGNAAEVYSYNAPGTQYLQGQAARDVFVVGAAAAGYGYGKTLDGAGIVVWHGAEFDILTGFEVIRFNDLDVQVAGIV